METLPEMLKKWTWSQWIYPDVVCAWEWSGNIALMPLPDRCAIKLDVGDFAASVRVFNRTMSGDVDWRAFGAQDYGGLQENRNPAAFVSHLTVDLSKFRLDEFCRDIEKYIRFYQPPV